MASPRHTRSSVAASGSPLIAAPTLSEMDRHRIDDVACTIDDRHPVPFVERGARMRDAEHQPVAHCQRTRGTVIDPQVSVLVVERADAPTRVRRLDASRTGRGEADRLW